MKRVAIDLQALRGRRTGHCVYLEGVWGNLRKLSSADIEMVAIDKVRHELNTIERIVWDQVLLPFEVRKTRADALFVPAFSVPYYSPVPVITTAHDLTALLYPHTLKPISRWYWSRLVPQGLTRAHAIIAISEWTKQKLVNLLHIPEERITVVHLGVDERYKTAPDREALSRVKEKYQFPASFILTVGTLEPKRNHATLIKAYARLGDNAPPLFLVGGRGAAYISLENLIASLHLENRVRIVERVSQEELPIFYRSATVLVIPSLDEGFGLPAVEGMASGVAIVAARSGALPEVLSDAAELFEATDVDDLVRQLAHLLGSEKSREELVARGTKRSRDFSWAKTAEQTFAVIKRVCQGL